MPVCSRTTLFALLACALASARCAAPVVVAPTRAPDSQAADVAPSADAATPLDVATLAAAAPPPPRPRVVTRPVRPEPAALPAVALEGCPPPPRTTPHAHHPPPWRPTELIPESQLPPADPPAPRTASTSIIEGPGVWIWRARLCEGGDPAAIVERARAAGMLQIWLRVGDSHDGFYAAATLEAIVPRAHAAGIKIIGWGFPYLWDPVSDAAWGRAALEWKASTGDQLDGFSPDIEGPSEGVRINAKRATVYLGLLRPAAASTHRPLIATVFRPTPSRWRSYPYREMAPYIDAWAPMVYWGCREPGAEGMDSVARLKELAPVHVIGQGYSMGDDGGRVTFPSGAEIARFCDASRRAGAVGASLWHWADMTPDEWNALSGSWWPQQRSAAP